MWFIFFLQREKGLTLALLFVHTLMGVTIHFLNMSGTISWPTWVTGCVVGADTMRSTREAWWLNGRMSDCCSAVLGLNLAPPQPTADCQSPGGLPPGMALGYRLTSVRGNRGDNNKNEPLVRQKQIKKKKWGSRWSHAHSLLALLLDLFKWAECFKTPSPSPLLGDYLLSALDLFRSQLYDMNSRSHPMNTGTWQSHGCTISKSHSAHHYITKHGCTFSFVGPDATCWTMTSRSRTGINGLEKGI